MQRFKPQLTAPLPEGWFGKESITLLAPDGQVTDFSALEWGVYLACGFGLGAVLWFIAARRYHNEKLAISA